MNNDVVAEIFGSRIIWEGHLCEGSTLGLSTDLSTFCLWTRCGKQDVPANGAHRGNPDEVYCLSCIDEFGDWLDTQDE